VRSVTTEASIRSCRRIDRDSPVPYYHQVKDSLRDSILNSTWPPGTALPSEADICEVFGVSRITVRQALAELELEGLVRRERGRGTFVAEPKIRERIVGHLTGFYEDMTAQGLEPQTRVLNKSIIEAPPWLAETLEVMPEEDQAGIVAFGKDALVEELGEAITEASAFCAELGIELPRLESARGFERIKLLDDAVDAILANDETKLKYLSLAGRVALLYRAILPDPAALEFGPARTVLVVIAQKIRSLLPHVDISEIVEDVEILLDKSIETATPAIGEEPGEYIVDLSQIDFYALRKRFEQGHRHIEAEKLRGVISDRLGAMVALNKSRIDLAERFERLIDEYNAGSQNVQLFFEELLAFAKDLSEEEKRGIAEGLTEEELAVFDLLTKPDPTLTKKEEQEVKKVAKDLMETLKREKLVLDWRKKQQARAAVWICIGRKRSTSSRRRTPPSYSRASATLCTSTSSTHTTALATASTRRWREVGGVFKDADKLAIADPRSPPLVHRCVQVNLLAAGFTIRAP